MLYTRRVPVREYVAINAEFCPRVNQNGRAKSAEKIKRLEFSRKMQFAIVNNEYRYDMAGYIDIPATKAESSQSGIPEIRDVVSILAMMGMSASQIKEMVTE